MKDRELYPKYPIIVLSGVTASGKSSLALELAQQFNGVIFNGDSKQVFREIPVSTAQPELSISEGKSLSEGIEHLLYGYRSLYDPFNVTEYLEDLQKAISQVEEYTPIFIAGGSGLYIDSFIYGYRFNELSDAYIDERGSIYTGEELRSLHVEELLELIPPHTIEKLNSSDRENSRRLVQVILRGYERLPREPVNHLYLYLDIDKEVLLERIEKRTSMMFSSGLVKEAEQFREMIIQEDPRLNIIGLKEFKGYFEGIDELAKVKELINIHTSQYAKRQRTWFRNVERRFKVNESEEFESQISNFISSFATP